MSKGDVKRLAATITSHSWNGDGSKVALCPNNNEIHIYAYSKGSFTLEHKLTEHDQVVTGIDWAPKSNRIVSCSHDRNAYVWTFKDNKWKPVLVILRINRAATDVKWSPAENKFAVASAARCVSVCYFEEDNDWWVSKHIKKHKSTVLKVDWHPNNAVIVTASSDFKARIFSAWIKGVDKGAPASVWGPKVEQFGELLVELEDAVGWIHVAKWSPNGNQIAYAGHDSVLAFVDVSSASPRSQVVVHKELPFVDLVWFGDSSVVAVGHDNAPTLFSNQGGWKLSKVLDTGSGGGATLEKGPSAKQIFQNKVDRAEEKTETKLVTKHQNCITCIQKYAGGYSTSAVDGTIIVWDAPK